MISNAGLRSRLKQAVILAVIILIGIIISHAAGAQNFHQAKSKHFRAKYRTQIKWAAHACSTIEKRRTKKDAKPVFAFLKGKPKYQPQAEVDAPTWASRGNSNKVRKENLVAAK